MTPEYYYRDQINKNETGRNVASGYKKSTHLEDVEIDGYVLPLIPNGAG